jgi:hypothetical protein
VGLAGYRRVLALASKRHLAVIEGIPPKRERHF